MRFTHLLMGGPHEHGAVSNRMGGVDLGYPARGSFTYGCRRTVRSGHSFHRATAVEAMFWSIITVVFLVTPLNKLHILWLLPVSYVGAQFLVIAGVPALTPPILLLTEVFLKFVLAGTQTPPRSAAVVWERILKGVEGGEEFKQIVLGFLVPDKIRPVKFRSNWIALSRWGIPAAHEHEENVGPTPSVGRFCRSFLDRPLGYPDWFLAGYPDVASWVVDGLREEGEVILRNMFGDLSEDEWLDKGGHIRARHLRILIDNYRRKTGLTLECSG